MSPSNPDTSFSLVVCCYNSDWVIESTLEHILRLKLPQSLVLDIVVVDNNSTDRTVEITERMVQKTGLRKNLRVVGESKQGLSFARIRGMNEARGRWVVFCDDDNYLDPDYIEKAYEILTSRPDIGLLGGYGKPRFDTPPEPPVEQYLPQYALGPQGEKAFEDITKSKGYVYGAGMIVRKDAWNYIFSKGFQFYNLGRAGGVLTGGEDVELGNAIRLAGFRICYAANLTFVHHLPSRRLTWEYLKRMNYGNGYSSALMMGYQDRPAYKNTHLYLLLWFAFRAASAWIDHRLHPNQPDKTLRYQSRLGGFHACLKEKNKIRTNREQAQAFQVKVRSSPFTDDHPSSP